MNKFESLKTTKIGQSAAKLRTGEGSQTIPQKGSRGHILSPEIARLENCVYMLTEESTIYPVYIGKTRKSLRKRYNEHFSDAKRNTSRVSRWFVKRRLANTPPRMIPLECGCGNTEQREVWWINYFTKKGFKLINLTKGGDGMSGYKHSDLSKAMIFKALKGKKKTTEQIAQLKLRARPVFVYSLNGEFIQEFRTAAEASVFIGRSLSSVTKAASTHLNSGDYQVRYHKVDKLPSTIRYYKPKSYREKLILRNKARRYSRCLHESVG